MTCKRLRLILPWVLMLTGCIDSPLLNHREAAAAPGPLQDEATSCPLHFAGNDICASLQWDRTPSEENEGRFILRFWNHAEAGESGPYSNPPFSVRVKLWMPSMGHGSAPVRVSPLRDGGNAPLPGIFEATGVYFPMRGHWEIWLEGLKGNEIIGKAKMDHYH